MVAAEPKTTTPFAHKVRQIKARFGYNTSELARIIGLNQQTLQRIESGQTTNINVEIAVALREKCGVSYSWFLSGEGPMLESENDQPTINRLREEIESKNRTIQRLAEKLASKRKGVSITGQAQQLGVFAY